MADSKRGEEQNEPLYGEGFASVLLVCATIADVCIGGDGAGICVAAMVGMGWMVWANSQ